jgi:hypothetical protein
MELPNLRRALHLAVARLQRSPSELLPLTTWSHRLQENSHRYLPLSEREKAEILCRSIPNEKAKDEEPGIVEICNDVEDPTDTTCINMSASILMHSRPSVAGRLSIS